MKIILTLQKNDGGKYPYVQGGKYPYFTLNQGVEQKDGSLKWSKLGAFWLKEKNGKKYYSGSLNEGVEIITPEVVNEKIDKKEIEANDIPFD